MAGGDGDQTTGGKPAPKQVSGATDKQNVYKVTRVFLKVLVRTDFLARAPFLINSRAAGGVEFHWTGGEAVAHATVTLPGADPVETGRDGTAKLDITNVDDGNYNVKIEMLTPVTANWDAVAGPDLGRGLASMPSRIYRPLLVPITLLDKKLKNAVDPYNADTGATWGRIGNSTQTKISDTLLPIDWRPVWIKSPGEGAVRTGTDVSLLVCHNTSGPLLGSTISTFTGNGGDSAHYVIEHDGHVIKFCREDHVVSHAGRSPGDAQNIGVVWGGRREVNSISVGIEMVHEEKPNDEEGIAYHEHQVKALIALMEAVRADSTLRIPAHRVVGHADVDFSYNNGGPTTSNGSLGSRDMDPGQVFVWEKVEAAGLGMIPQAEPDMSKAYGGFFVQKPDGVLKPGDKDAKKIWGGNDPDKNPWKPWDEKTKKGMPLPDSLTPIQELQEDLSHIGYTANQDGFTADDKAKVSDKAGEFHAFTQFQVKKFQWHFFSGSRRRKKDGKLIRENGQVDLETAKMIKRVRAGIP